MEMERIQKIVIEQLLPTGAAEKMKEAMRTISTVQHGLYVLAESEDDEQLNLLKIGTVFQFFFIDTLAKGKKPTDLKEEDWKNISDKVLHYAVLEDEKSYSEFVFSLYADYIDISADALKRCISPNSFTAIKEISTTIRQKTELLKKDNLKETDYVDACLWLSLEAMLKLLATSLTVIIGQDRADLTAAVSQLAFEYGRSVLYAKEQALLAKYIENQQVLDKQLQQEYDRYIANVHAEADRFQSLIDKAFSPDLHESLLQSAALARVAGVKESELLTSVQDIDSFFMD